MNRLERTKTHPIREETEAKPRRRKMVIGWRKSRLRIACPEETLQSDICRQTAASETAPSPPCLPPHTKQDTAYSYTG